MDVWIGTCGYSYGDWVGAFYPAGTRPDKMLPFYARHFPLVELNYTFYRPPTAAALGRLADRTPPAFQFVVKLPHSLSHEQSPRDLEAFRQAVEELERRRKLAALLCQLPQATHDGRRSRAWLEALGRALGDLRLAVEFRHRSWARPSVFDWMSDQGLGAVAVDAPDLPDLFPRGWVQSGPWAYVRLHSRNAANWYASEKARCDFDYPDAALAEWADALRAAAAAGRTERAFILFNNCHQAQAPRNAGRLRALLERSAPGLRVAPPPAEPPPLQRTLFD